MTKAVIVAGAIAFAGVAMLAAITGAVAGTQPSIAGAGYGASRFALTDIPPEYLALYQAAAADQGLDWTVLAAIGKIETDHGRSTAPGVTSGVNAFGCCAGPMQFDLQTWETYGEGGDIYNPADAIPAAARYLKAAGAPKDYHRAVLTYNHSEAYYQDVMALAERYRGNAALGGSQALTLDGAEWLAPVPGTGAVCDRRIVPDVVWILATYHAALGDCYAPTGHEAGGEHPLGLATDIVPGPGGSWDLLDKLAHDMGWRESCASTGCASQPFIRPFRFIGWDGYPGHGRGSHIHLSWDHTGGSPADRVYTLRP
jgi:hypothetical protein